MNLYNAFIGTAHFAAKHGSSPATAESCPDSYHVEGSEASDPGKHRLISSECSMYVWAQHLGVYAHIKMIIESNNILMADLEILNQGLFEGGGGILIFAC